MDIIRDIIALASTVGLFGAMVARWIPNEKLYGWGLKVGQAINSIGTARMGSNLWEKLEDFIVNSIGEYLRGVKVGLDIDEEINEKNSDK